MLRVENSYRFDLFRKKYMPFCLGQCFRATIFTLPGIYFLSFLRRYMPFGLEQCFRTPIFVLSGIYFLSFLRRYMPFGLEQRFYASIFVSRDHFRHIQFFILGFSSASEGTQRFRATTETEFMPEQYHYIGSHEKCKEICMYLYNHIFA